MSLRQIAVGLLALGLAVSAQAQKTDLVVMVNGDRNTGEIKSYDQGRLLLSTDAQGDIKLKWNRILSVTSDKVFDVELADGSHVFGELDVSTPPGKLTVVSSEAIHTVEFLSAFRMTPLYQTFWSRIDGSVDLGFNYTQANQFLQFNLNGEATYRTKFFDVSSTLGAFFSKQEGVTSAQRANWDLGYVKFLPRRWFATGFTGLDRNQDLGLDLRVSAGGGVGRFLIQTNQSRLGALVGIVGNHEDPLEGEGQYNVEAVVRAEYSRFMYDFPKLTIGGTLSVIPSLTDSGRLRLQADLQVQREIVSDFYVAISIFDSFDSRPPTEGAAKNDWGPVVSVGYKF